jgi:hypothetical protein
MWSGLKNRHKLMTNDQFPIANGVMRIPDCNKKTQPTVASTMGRIPEFVKGYE